MAGVALHPHSVAHALLQKRVPDVEHADRVHEACAYAVSTPAPLHYAFTSAGAPEHEQEERHPVRPLTLSEFEDNFQLLTCEVSFCHTTVVMICCSLFCVCVCTPPFFVV